MANPFNFTRIRTVAIAAVLTVGLTVPIASAVQASADPGDPSVASCTVSLTPTTFGPTDAVTLTVTSAPAPNSSGAGNDGLGPALARMGGNSSSPLSTTVPALALAGFGLIAPGSHTLDVYGVDGSGNPTGPILCTTSYTYNAEPTPPSFTTTSLPDAAVGTSYSQAVQFNPGGALNTVTGCTVTADVPGLTVTAGDLTSTCGTLAGTPTTGGSYTVSAQVVYQIINRTPESLEPGSLAPEAVPTVSTFAIKGSWTLTVTGAAEVPVKYAG